MLSTKVKMEMQLRITHFTFHLVGSNFIISTKVKMKMQFILSKTCQYCNNIFDRKSEFTVHIEKNISITKWTGPLL